MYDSDWGESNCCSQPLDGYLIELKISDGLEVYADLNLEDDLVVRWW
jgi:hypothetical protein